MPRPAPLLPLLLAVPLLTALLLSSGLLLAGCEADGRAASHASRQTSPGETAAPDTTRRAASKDTTGAPLFAAWTDGGAAEMPAPEQKKLIREDSLWKEALRIHYNALVLDGHVDTPTLMVDEDYQAGRRHTHYRAHLDWPRMTDGGLDGAFFAAYVAAAYGEGASALARARTQIQEIKKQVAASPDQAALARTAADVRRIARSGRKAVLLGLEGGHALMASPDTLRALAEEGVRCVTLTHVNTNSWADASQSLPRHGGLTDRGRAMVRALNRAGVLVDLSHASDSTFYDALAVTEAPPILSHSSLRALTPNVRNASDAMLRALAAKDGVVMINFFDALVNPHLDAEVMAAVERRMTDDGVSLRQLWRYVYDEKKRRGLPGATLDDVLDHVDHAVQVAGIEHVGLGSDFDGVFDLPAGLEDVTRLPYVTHGLLQRGYSEAAIYQILGGNTLRVLEAAEKTAARLQASEASAR